MVSLAPRSAIAPSEYPTGTEVGSLEDIVWAVGPSSPNAYTRYVKRVFDLIAALILFPCCLPIMIFSAVLVFLETGGIPIFAQKRVGMHGKIFSLLKIRTMRSGTQNQSFRTEPNDSRVTTIGSFLRETKLDELPQLWHVITGDMSLIGPRPLSVDETEHLILVEGFDGDGVGLIPTVRPGLTGLEQCLRSSLAPYERRFKLNGIYQEQISFKIDLWIFAKTLSVCPLLCAIATTSLVGCALWIFVAR